jgi:deoxyxylulose-5-phosphate synthase
MCDACSNQNGVLVVSERVAVVCDDNDAHEIHLLSRASCLARIYTMAKKSDEKNSQMVNAKICWHYAIGASDPRETLELLQTGHSKEASGRSDE